MAGSPGVAGTLAGLAERFLGAPLPVRLRGWDGSVAGPRGAPVLVIRSKRALRRLLWEPNELGLARAYVSGDIDVDGDLKDGLSRLWRLVRQTGIPRPRVPVATRLGLLSAALRFGALGRPPDPPTQEIRLSGTNRATNARHRTLPTGFYRTLLDPTMAYSCGYWVSDDPGYTVADAQRDKLDLICRKLDLLPGMRLLDVGCGWGSLLVHAAVNYGVRAIGVTLSAQQRDFVAALIAQRGLGDRVEVHLRDYREIGGGDFDAIGSIEMGEHRGPADYPAYAAQLFRLLKPEGRVLVQQASRMSRSPREAGHGSFVDRYAVPKTHVRPVAETIAALAGSGLEVRDVESLREHYGWTVDAWARTLDERAERFVELIGGERLRVGRLYLAGVALLFQENRMGVDQVLAVRPSADGVSGMPRTRLDWAAVG
ncbi:MAG: class I SAM-dependent methyltransferase [Kutzneria sp.]|nr:class I SAM-dependent methyltransferase [Kutzneria sp.]